MIKIEGLTVSYGKKKPPVLHEITCTVPAKKITVIAGPNGSGKSTLLKSISGFLKAKSGRILLDGKNLCEYSSQDRARKLAFLPQSCRIPELTVRQLVLRGRFPYTAFPRSYSRHDYEVVETCLSTLNMTVLGDCMLSEISGGQQQKAWLAMALAQETDILVLDEPLTFLDVRQQLELLQVLKNLSSQGKTILLIVHDLHTALTFADNMIVLSGGSLAAEGQPGLIAENGIIDRVFGIHTEKITAPGGRPVYTFTGGDLL